MQRDSWSALKKVPQHVARASNWPFLTGLTLAASAIVESVLQNISQAASKPIKITKKTMENQKKKVKLENQLLTHYFSETHLRSTDRYIYTHIFIYI